MSASVCFSLNATVPSINQPHAPGYVCVKPVRTDLILREMGEEADSLVRPALEVMSVDELDRNLVCEWRDPRSSQAGPGVLPDRRAVHFGFMRPHLLALPGARPA